MPAHYSRVAFRSTQVASGALCVNVFHLEVDTLTDPPNYATIASDIDAWLRTSYLAVLSANFIFQDITVTEETYPGATPAQGLVTIGLPGTRTAPDTNLSVALCAVLQLRTATPKKYARGHLFLPPAMSSNSISTGGIFLGTSAYMNNAAVFAGQLRAGHTAGSTGYAPIIFSRTRVQQGLTPYQFPVVQTVLKSDQHFLRSRLTAP